MLALSRMDRMTRMVVFGMLAFAGSFLLGESYLPTPSYFWGLGAGRLLFCLLLVALPATDAGRFRPFLVLLAGASFTVVFWAPSFLFARWVMLTLLYLTMEVSIDALVLNRATEQEVPMELGWLAGCRLCGLWLGLFVQYAGLTEELRPRLPFSLSWPSGQWLGGARPTDSSPGVWQSLNVRSERNFRSISRFWVAPGLSPPWPGWAATRALPDIAPAPSYPTHFCIPRAPALG